MAIKNLWIIMPVYNEQEAIEKVLYEWIPAIERLNIDYLFCILNDGSNDATLEKITALQNRFPKIKIINKENSGHGQTCIEGYKMAIENGADWIFQIDSDGQCDAQYFEKLISFTERYKSIYGVRKVRDDGIKRVVISAFVVVFTFLATGKWIPDPNVPYRLMHADLMKQFVYKIPENFYLANIFVSVGCVKYSKIKWIPIHFRNRMGGSPSVKTFTFIKHGFKLFKQLRDANK